MFENNVSTTTPTFLGTLYSWFTPTVLFLLLQLVIGTIFIISNLAKQQQPHENLARSPSLLQRLKSINTHFPQSLQNQNFQLPRSPSLLQTLNLNSINLYSYLPSSKLTQPQEDHHDHDHDHDHDRDHDHDHDHEHGHDHDPELHDHLQHNGNHTLDQEQASLDEVYAKLQQGQEGHFSRSQSDTKPASGEPPVKLPRKMKKSASSKSAFSHFKEDDIVETRRPATVREGVAAAAADADDHEVDAKADDFINRFKQQLKLQRLDSIMRYKEMIGRGSAK
ncbi:hypothetical protein Fmac_031796 [Flemingia macrophylla]|uniref:DUF4408 domain-containing protein n=1 Tax=Flemingia macrophylla TaxID=520843 RepID=A0ABD1L333_9FABA